MVDLINCCVSSKTPLTDFCFQRRPLIEQADVIKNSVLSPSEQLENLVRQEDGNEIFMMLKHQLSGNDGLSRDSIGEICKIYDLNTQDVIKYEKYIF
ncbi:hypothetical protein MTR_8g023540 [Medicago truncatula]|uniref:Uncharacterized protein n=1 Tax=Medicago truncatula TaxID=3880 RepID=G7L9X8_MEDTR|nr:hypothetical protein MTR_8g023540 [Medicago truncatula]